jgi:xanthine dehydrogenase accessory factor
MRNVRLLATADELRSRRTPFVHATVVRAERPTSARVGDTALVLPNGTVEGFVGGACAESTVRLEGLRMLRAGDSGLLRITPGGEGAVVADGVRTVDNPCLSGGTLEIFLESVVPPMLVHVFGDAPIARALARVGEALEAEVRLTTDPEAPIASDTAAFVAASHGRDEPAVLAAALRSGVGYVALVASRRRAASVLAEVAALGIPAEQCDRVRAPAGLDIGARSAPEIALSILAELVARRQRGARPEPGRAAQAPAAAAEERDPVCGMAVAALPATLRVEHEGAAVYFCGPGCRQAFLDAPDRYAAPPARVSAAPGSAAPGSAAR